jgi:hypothetical protein
MKFLVGTITGIVLAVGGVAYASNTHQTTAATDLAQAEYAPQVVPQKQTVVPQKQTVVPQTQTAATRVQQLAGELKRKDTGAFELKIGERDLRIIVAHAKVTNVAGRPMPLPLDEANARISAKLLPRNAWRLDDDGQLLPTFAASRVVLIPTPREQTSEADQTEG